MGSRCWPGGEVWCPSEGGSVFFSPAEHLSFEWGRQLTVELERIRPETLRKALMITSMTAKSSARPFEAIDAAAPTNVRWRIFLLMLMLISINYVDRASISVAMPIISKEFNIGPATQGFISAPSSLPMR